MSDEFQEIEKTTYYRPPTKSHAILPVESRMNDGQTGGSEKKKTMAATACKKGSAVVERPRGMLRKICVSRLYASQSITR